MKVKDTPHSVLNQYDIQGCGERGQWKWMMGVGKRLCLGTCCSRSHAPPPAPQAHHLYEGARERVEREEEAHAHDDVRGLGAAQAEEGGEPA